MHINLADIDFSQLMDLRVDYAFKLFFAAGDKRRLISLLNAIFANKGINRKITDLTIVNPALEKASGDDKLSILDIRAILSDKSTACIEMHMYDLKEFKRKSVRSWARAYAEELDPGQGYLEQRPVICIAFINGPIDDATGAPVEKVHALFQVAERDDHRLLLEDMEMHFINMRAFVNAWRKGGDCEAETAMFTKWLMLITQAEIKDRDAIISICEEEEELRMAVETLSRLSADKINRQAYQRRLDEIHSYNMKLAKIDELKSVNEELKRDKEESDRRMKAALQNLMNKGHSISEAAEVMSLAVWEAEEMLNSDAKS